MKRIIELRYMTMSVVLLALLGSNCNNKDASTSADTFNVYKQTMNNICKVQKPTERPLFGDMHLGPYSKKEDATKAMCNDIDPNMEDTKKCWGTLPDDACKK